MVHNPSGFDTALEIAQELLPSLEIKRAANVSYYYEVLKCSQLLIYMVHSEGKVNMQVLVLKDLFENITLMIYLSKCHTDGYMSEFSSDMSKQKDRCLKY